MISEGSLDLYKGIKNIRSYNYIGTLKTFFFLVNNPKTTRREIEEYRYRFLYHT